MDEIIKEIKEQPVGPMFSIQADEVTDISNKEQMALLLRYLKDGKPIERLMEYILCESITGVALCEDIQRTLSGLNLDLQNTVSQTYVGATNFSGQIKGCPALFQQTVPHATYFHCSSHDLNLALCHACKDIPEIRNRSMLSCVIEVGLFFKYSPKRLHVLEATLLEYNMMKNVDKRINTAKIKLFCSKRWVERHLVLEEIITLQTSLAACEQKLFANIFLCMYLLMVVPVSTAATKRSHSGLQIVKTNLQSTMGQQRLTALMLLYIHKDIQINYPKIIDIYANRHPRRMLFKNPLAEEQEEKQKSM